jgi:hypothetical protein
LSDSTGNSGYEGDDKRPTLGLMLPNQAVPKADNMLLDLRETDAWFQALPMANVGETARQVYKTLVEFNRLVLPNQLRAKIVEKFRPPVEYICNNLLKYYVDIGLPLSKKGNKTASLARELQKELAISYKIMVHRIVAGDLESFDKRLLIVAIHRALHYTGETMLQNALVYSAWPTGLWREINSLYAYASQNGIHLVPVKPDDKASRSSSTTIEDKFKALMLFASATPHRLRQSHAQLLFAKLPEWIDYTLVPEQPDGGTSLGRFNVDLWSDSAPLHNALRTPLPGNRMAVLDVRELLKKLRNEFEQAPWDNRGGLHSGKPVVTRPLLRLLIMAWSRPPDRRFVRTRLNFELQIVAGLHAVYGNLMADENTPFETTRAAVFALDEAPPEPRPGRRGRVDWSAGELDSATLSPLDSDFVTDSLLSESVGNRNRGILTSSVLNDFADTGTRDADAASRTGHHRVKTINESAGGYCVRWEGDHIPRVKIGELIGIQSPSDHHTYGLGVIRWMKQLVDLELDIGLEVIATRCQAGDVREVAGSAGRNRAPSFKCLLLQGADPDADSSTSLVMSAMSLQTGVDLWLAINGVEQRIRLTKLMEFSSAFARYQIEHLDRGDDQSDNGDTTSGEFDDLWGSL